MALRHVLLRFLFPWLLLAMYVCNVCLTDVVLCFKLFVARFGRLRAKRRAERQERHGVFCLLWWFAWFFYLCLCYLRVSVSRNETGRDASHWRDRFWCWGNPSASSLAFLFSNREAQLHSGRALSSQSVRFCLVANQHTQPRITTSSRLAVDRETRRTHSKVPIVMTSRSHLCVVVLSCDL